MGEDDICCCTGRVGGGRGRFASESRLKDALALLDIACGGGGGGTLVMGCWLEERIALPPLRRYLWPEGPSSPPPPELRLEPRRLLRSCRRDSRSAAASCSFNRRSVTWRPSLCIFTLTLTGGLLGFVAPFDIDAEVALPLRDGRWSRLRESCGREGDCDGPRRLRLSIAAPAATAPTAPAATAATTSSRTGGSRPYALDSFAAVLSESKRAGSGATRPSGICAEPNWAGGP